LIASATVSVVIASHGRPEHLRRCLTALRYQAHDAFEVIVVADAAGLAALTDHPSAPHIKTVAFDTANLSRARNLGLAEAAGDIVAFIDDDSIAEPTWLSYLSEPIAQGRAAATVGAVRGRNGISFQSHSPFVDRNGFTRDPGLHAEDRASEGFVPKLVGTNMAVRRDALLSIGGFDEEFRYVLEDADVSLRLAAAGCALSFAPEAQVHHLYAPSSRRGADRCPRSLHEIGRSLALFLGKHAAASDIGEVTAWFRANERRRALDHMVRGNCTPGDVGRLLASFDAGLAEGVTGTPGEAGVFADAPSFRPFPGLRGDAEVHLLAARRSAPLAQEAARLAAEGHVVTVFAFSPTALYHHAGFRPDGFWTQIGGQFGRSERINSIVQASGFVDRVRTEWARITLHRTPAGATFRTQIR
jgi:GT2 family glycosyltransferase